MIFDEDLWQDLRDAASNDDNRVARGGAVTGAVAALQSELEAAGYHEATGTLFQRYKAFCKDHNKQCDDGWWSAYNTRNDFAHSVVFPDVSSAGDCVEHFEAMARLVNSSLSAPADVASDALPKATPLAAVEESAGLVILATPFAVPESDASISVSSTTVPDWTPRTSSAGSWFRDLGSALTALGVGLGAAAPLLIAILCAIGLLLYFARSTAEQVDGFHVNLPLIGTQQMKRTVELNTPERLPTTTFPTPHAERAREARIAWDFSSKDDRFDPTLLSYVVRGRCPDPTSNGTCFERANSTLSFTICIQRDSYFLEVPISEGGIFVSLPLPYGPPQATEEHWCMKPGIQTVFVPDAPGLESESIVVVLLKCTKGNACHLVEPRIFSPENTPEHIPLR